MRNLSKKTNYIWLEEKKNLLILIIKERSICILKETTIIVFIKTGVVNYDLLENIK